MLRVDEFRKRWVPIVVLRLGTCCQCCAWLWHRYGKTDDDALIDLPPLLQLLERVPLTCIHVPVSTCLYPCACIHVPVSTCLYPRACIHVPVSTCLYPRACIHVPVSTCLYPRASCHVPVSTCLYPRACIHLPRATCLLPFIMLAFHHAPPSFLLCASIHPAYGFLPHAHTALCFLRVAYNYYCSLPIAHMLLESCDLVFCAEKASLYCIVSRPTTLGHNYKRALLHSVTTYYTST
jgi:hypothetical protein